MHVSLSFFFSMNIITLTLAINLEKTAKVCVCRLVNILQINFISGAQFSCRGYSLAGDGLGSQVPNLPERLERLWFMCS